MYNGHTLSMNVGTGLECVGFLSTSSELSPRFHWGMRLFEDHDYSRFVRMRIITISPETKTFPPTQVPFSS